MTPADKKSFIDNLKIYGTDFTRWPETHLADIENYLDDLEIREIYETERQTDAALDLLKAQETPAAFSIDSLALTPQKTVTLPRAPVFRMALAASFVVALAASFVVALLVLTPVFLETSPQEPVPVDQFLNEVASMTDPENIDPNIFFEETAQAPAEQDIDQFLDEVFDNPADPIEEKDIWEMFTDGENARG